jgi:rhodanese-related sulfurtransferase
MGASFRVFFDNVRLNLDIDHSMHELLTRLPQFIGHHVLLVAAFIVIILALIALEVSRQFRGFRELTPGALVQMINRGSPLVIDLSAIADYEKGHITGSKHVAPSQFDPENKDLAKARDLQVVTVCRNGVESAKAARRLVRAGFTNVATLGGGIGAWKQAELPLAKGRN